MIRHLLVTNDFPPKVGGIQTYLYELWRRLDPATSAVLTATSDPRAADFDATWRAEGRTITRVSSKTAILPTRELRRAIEAAASDFDAELILLDPAWPLGLLGPSLSRPYGVVLHGAEVTIPARLPVLRRQLRRVLEGASVVVAAGGYPEAEARALAGTSLGPVIQVPPGVDPERFQPLAPEAREAVRRDLGLTPETQLVVGLGRLVPRKGFDVLIEAAATLRTRFPDLVVLLAGTGRHHRDLEQLAARLEAPVRLLGFVEDGALPSLLGAADLFASPCRNRWGGLEQEGFGIVYLEAAAAGVPQLAGRSGGAADAVEDGVTGLVIRRPQDPAAVATALASLLADPIRSREMGAAARARAVASFGYDSLSSRLEEGLSMALTSAQRVA